MLTVPENVWAALGETVVTTQTWALATYQGANQRLDVDTDGQIEWQATGDDAQASGKLTVYGTGDPVLIPQHEDDLLYPGRGQEVIVCRDVIMRGTRFTITLGVFRLVDDGDGGSKDTRRGRVTRWKVPLTLADRLRMHARAKVLVPAAPQSTSMWAELQDLALMPLLRGDIPDRTVPAGIGYDDRQTAIKNLAALASAVPSLTREGALTLRQQDRWAEVTEPEFDIPGTISWDAGHTDDFFNWVWAHDPDNKFNGFASFTDDSDPKSIGRAGPSTYEHSSPLYTSDRSAAAGAATTLDRLLNRRSATVTVQVGMQGLCLDLGDVGWFHDTEHGRAVMGEVAGFTVHADPTAPIDVTVTAAETEGT